MNHAFRTLWSEARQCWIAVPEQTRASGKSNRSGKSSRQLTAPQSRQLTQALTLALTSVPAISGVAANLPTNGNVVAGDASVSVSGNSMTITQSSSKAAINWEGFDIGKGYTVTFVQPSAQAAALNRVTGANVSQIQGSLLANGQVYLINPNGVLFTKDAQVAVGSLVASTLSMSTDDFMAGRNRLSGNSTASVVNEGSLIATGGDGKAGHVALIAARVINSGDIQADKGSVSLAAASKVTLDLGGPVPVQIEEGALNALIENGGAIRADGGRILMTAKAAGDLQAAAINHKGYASAKTLTTGEDGQIRIAIAGKGKLTVDGKLDVSATSGKAGTVELSAQDIALTSTAEIDARGASGGGTVLVGGDWQGSGTMLQAKTVTMEHGAVIDASATQKGDGGKIVLWSNVHDAESSTVVEGTLIADAGPEGGDGGKIETSGRLISYEGSLVSAAAPKGKAGEWLIDPDNMTVSGAGATTIANRLNNGTSVTINTTGTCDSTLGTCVNFNGSLGDVIMMGANMSLSPLNDVTFTINAGGSITLGGNISASSHALSLSLNPGNSKSIIFRSATNVSTNGGSITLNGPVEIWSDVALNSGGGNILFGSTVESLRLDTFTTTGNSTWTAPTGLSAAEVLVVAGGGGGGYDAGGGGGGGGVVYNTSYAVTAGTTYNITVGSGGSGASGYTNASGLYGNTGASGGNSSFGALTALGGGGGGGRRTLGVAGGDTATGGVTNVTGTGNLTYLSGTPLNDGGSGHVYYKDQTGAGTFDADGGYGGGGAGGAGGRPSSGQGGNGGIGLANAITGITQIYGSGGGGGVWSSGSTSGTGGPGAAAGGNYTQNANAVAAADPLTASASYGGGGAGGGVVSEGHGNGTAGASGAVMIKYQFPNNLTINAGAGTVRMNGTVGNVGAVGNLSLSSASGSTVIAGGLVVTTGSQVYGNPVNVAAATTLRGASVTTNSTMSASGNALTITTDAISIGGVLSGTAGLTIQPLTASTTIGLNTGTGSLNLNGTEIGRLSGFSQITIGGLNGTGAVNLASATSFGSSTTLRASNATVDITGALNVTGSLVVNTTGTTNISGGNVTTTGTQTYVGPLTIGADDVLSATTVNTQSTVDGAAHNLNITGNLNVGGAITNLANLSVSGTTTLGANISATGNQTFTGLVTVSNAARALTAGNNITLTGGASASNQSLSLTATSGGVTGGGSINLSGANLSITQGGNSTLGSNIAGAGALIKQGAGTLTLTGNNSYSGGTALNAGRINLGSANAIGTTGTISFGGGTLEYSASNTSDYSARFSNAASQQYSLDTNGQNVTLATALTSSSGTLTKLGTGMLTMTGSHTYTGNTTISAGTLRLGDGTTSGFIGGTVNGSTATYIINNSELLVNNPTDVTLYARIYGSGNLTKSGAGNLTLSPVSSTAVAAGAGTYSTFTGNVSILAGSLKAVAPQNSANPTSGALGNSMTSGRTITVSSGATLETASNDLFGYVDYTPNVSIILNGGRLTNNGYFLTLGNVTLNGGTIHAEQGFSAIYNSYFLRGNLTVTGNTVSCITSNASSSTAGVHLSDALTLDVSDITSGADLIISAPLKNRAGTSNSVAFVKSGNGTVVLSGNNTFTGTTNITAGVVILGDGGTAGSLVSDSVNISSGAQLQFNRSNALSFTANITGAGSISQIGSGTTTLNGTSNYTGGTNINCGTLSLASASAIGVAATAGTVSFNGGILQYSSSNTVDYSGRFSNAANQSYKIDTNGQSVTLASNLTSSGGSLSKLGSGTLTLSGTNSYDSGSNLIAGTLNLGSSSAIGTTGTISFTGGTLQYSAQNSTDYSSRFSTAASQLFRIDTNSQNVSFASILSSANGTLTKLGTGNLTLTANNTYNGTTTITGGLLIIGNGSSSGSISSASLVNNGNLAFNRSDALTYSGNISGSGGVAQGGSGTLTLSGNNSYTGGTALSAGVLVLGSANAISTSGTIGFLGGTLKYSASNSTDYSSRFSTSANQSFNIDTDTQNVTFASVLNSTNGTLTKLGTGNLTLTGTNTYNGTTTVSSGALIIGNGTANGSIASASVIDNASLVFNRSDATTFSVNISGNGTLTKSGAGTLTLSGNNTYTGGTSMTSGTLNLGSADAIGSNGTLSFSGGTLQYSAQNSTDYTSRFSSAASQQFRIDTNSQNLTFASVISSSGGTLVKLGAGNLTLTANNTYTGSTTVNAGNLSLGNGNASGMVAGSIVNNATLIFNRSDDLTYSGAISGTGLVRKSAANNLTLDGTSTFSGGVDFAAGTLTVNSSGALGTTGTLQFSGGTLQHAANGTTDYSSRIASTANQSINISLANAVPVTYASVISGNGSTLQKSGGGSLYLTATNTFTGLTSVLAGSLVLGNGTSNGSVAGEVNVSASANLIFKRTGAASFSGNISGAGNLYNAGTGTVTLSGNNSYTGTTKLIDGILSLNSTNAIGTSGSIEFMGGTLQHTTNNLLDYGSRISTLTNRNIKIDVQDQDVSYSAMGGIDTQLTKLGLGNLTLTGNNTYTGSTNVMEGRLFVGNGSTTGQLNGAIANNGTVIFNRSDAVTQSGVISGNGSLIKQGTGNLTLSGNNNYTGATTISTGRLIAGNANALGSTGCGTTVSSGATLTLANNVVLAAEPISLGGTFTSEGNSTLASALTLTANAMLNAAANSTLVLSGAIDGNYTLSANGAGSGSFSFGNIGQSTRVAGVNITNAANVTFGGNVASSANVTVVASGDVAINGVMNVSGANATLSKFSINTTGSVTEGTSGQILAGTLALLGSGGNFTLNKATNNVGTLAADTGSVSYVNSGTLTVGVVNPTGVTATGPVSISTVSGDLIINQSISTSDSSTNAIWLNAGSSAAAGTASGGNIIYSGSPTLTTGVGGRVTLLTGSVNGSTAMATYVGSGSGHFRYNSDETATNYTTPLGNGTYLIYREQPTASFAAANATKVYDGVAYSGGNGMTATGTVNGDDALAFTYTGSAQGAKDAGNYAIGVNTSTWSALGYAIGTGTNGTLSITQKTLTLAGATNANKTYDGTTAMAANVTGYGALTGVVAGDDVSVSGVTVYSDANAGARTILKGSVALNGTKAGNYQLSWTDGSGTIDKAALTVTARADQKFVTQADNPTYNGVTYTGFVGAETASVLSGGLVITRSNAATQAAGTYTGVLTPSGLTAANYNITYVGGDYTITGADRLVIRFNNASTTYGTNANYTVQSAQYLSSTNLTIVSLAAPTVSGANYTFTDGAGGNASFTLGVGNSSFSTSGNLKVGNYTLTASNITESSANFNNNLVIVGALDVSRKAITNVTGISAASREYDGSTAATLNIASANFTGRVGNDSLALAAGSTGAFADKNAGVNKAVNISGLSLNGTDAGNYVLCSTVASTTANITARTVNVSGVTAADKVYDGTTTANASTTAPVFDRLVSGDLLTVSAGAANFADKNAGSNKTVTVSNLTLGGADASNYQLANATVNATANITARNITIANISAADKIYDATTNATLTTTHASFTGIVANDTLSVATAVGEFDNKNVGTGKTVTISNLTLGGASAANYQLSSTNATTTANISRANLTVSNATAQDKAYDSTTTANITGASIAPLGTDAVTLSLSSANFSSALVGSNKTVAAVYTLGGTDAGNYNLIQPTGLHASITGQVLTVTGLLANDKIYDGTTNATLNWSSVLFSGLQGSDSVTIASGIANFADKLVASGKAVTVSNLTLSGTNASNYVLTLPTGLTGNITAKTLTLSGSSNVTKTYDTNTAMSGVGGYGNLTGVVSGDTVNVSGAAVFDSANAGNRSILQGSVALAGADAGNYVLSWTNGNGTITPKTLTVTVNASAKFVTQSDPTGYNGVSYSGFAGAEDASTAGLNTGGLTITRLNATGNQSAGTYNSVLRANGITANNYAFQYVDGDFAIVAANQLLVTVNSANTTYGTAGSFSVADAKYLDPSSNTIVTLNATQIAGNAYSIDDGVGGTANFTLAANGTLSSAGLLRAGSYNVGATNISGNSTNFSNNLTVVGTLTVNTKGVSVVPGGVSKVYDGTTAMSGLSITLTGTETGDVVTGAGSGSFSQANVSRDANGSVVSNVGYTLAGLTLSGTDASNYFLTGGTSFSGSNGTITPANITAVSGIVAANKTYDGTTNATLNVSGAVFTGRVGADVLNLSTADGNFGTKNVGVNKLVNITNLTLGGTDAGNYDLIATSSSTTADISAKSLNISGAVANNKVYDRTTDATVDVSSATLSGVVGVENVTINASMAAASFADRNVANNIAVTASGYTLGGSDAGNYVLNQPTGLSGNITAKTITVAGVTAVNKVYDGNVSADLNVSGAVFTGVVAGDTIGAGLSDATFANKNVGTGKAVTVGNLALTGTSAGNYQLTLPTGLTANITGRSVAVANVTADNKVYDGTTNASLNLSNSPGLTGVLAADAASVTLDTSNASAVFVNVNAGVGIGVTASNFTLSGSEASNYLISQPSGLSANITQRSVTVGNLSALNKVYDGTTNATLVLTNANFGAVAANTGLVVGDQLIVASANGAFDTKNVGTGKTVNITGITLGGGAASNYVLTGTNASTTADITAKSLNVSGLAGVSRVYDGTTTATVNATQAQLVGVVTNDTVALNPAGYSASFADKNVGSGKTVTVSGYALSGADAGNYQLNQPTGLTANITAKELTGIGNVSAADKVYDATTIANITIANANFTGMVAGDSLVLASGTGRFADKNVAANKTVTVTGVSLGGTDAGNYVLNVSNATATATITVKTVTLNGSSNVSKTYDGLNSTPNGTAAYGNLSGVVAGDTVTISGSAVYDSAAAGARTVLNGSLALAGSDAANYQLQWANGSGVISKAVLTARANDDAKFVTQADTAGYAGMSYSGFVNNETIADINVTGLAISRTNANQSAGVYAGVLNASGITAANYSIVYTAGNYTIVPADQLLVRVTAVNATYGSAPQFTVASAEYLDSNSNNIASLTSPSISGNTYSYSDGVGGNANFTLGVLNGLTSTAGQLKVGAYQVGATNVTSTSINFSNNLTVVGNLTVTPKSVTVEPGGIAKTYDGSTAMTGLTISLNGTLAGDVITGAGTGNFSQATVSRAGNGAVVSNVGYTLSGLQLTGADSANYYLSGGSTLSGTNGTINPAAITAIGNLTAADKVYDATRTATLNLSGATFAGMVAGDTLTAVNATGLFDTKNVGAAKTVAITGLELGGAAASNYQLTNANASTTASITAYTLNVTGATASDRVYDATRVANVTGGAVSVLGSDVVTLSGANALFADKNVGSGKLITTAYTISGTDAGNYNLVQAGGLSANVTAKTITLNGSSNVSKTYDGQSSLAAGVSGYGNLSGVISGDTVAISGAAVYDSAAAGSRNVLQGTLALNGTDAGNYNLQWNDGSGSISKAVITVRANDDAKFVTQGDNASYAGVSYSGFVNNETVAALNVTGLAVARSNSGVQAAGIYTGVLSASGVSASNYSIAYQSGNYTITPADQLMIRVNALNVTYGSAAQFTIASAEYLASGNSTIVALSAPVVSGNTFTYSDGAGGNASFTLSPTSPLYSSSGLLSAGNYQVRATNITETSHNFSDTLTVVGNLTVNTKAISVVPGGVSKVYDGTTSMTGLTMNLSGVESGVVGGVNRTDAVTVGGSGQFASKDVSRAANGSVRSDIAYTLSGLSLSGADAANYYLTGGTSFSGSNGTITPKAITAVSNVSAADKVYDATTNASLNVSGAQFAGMLAGESLQLATATGNFDSKNVGAGKTVTVSGMSLGGTDANNYQLTAGNATTTANITQADLQVIGAVAQNKVYDRTTNATINGGTINLLGSDSVTLSAANATFADKLVGSGKNVTTNYTLSGTDAGNYHLLQPTGLTADITPKTITLAGGTNINKTYDGGTAMAANVTGYGNLTGVISGDTVSLTGATAYDAASAGNHTVLQGTVQLSGADANNYALSWTDGSGTIGKAALSVQVNNDAKFYTQADAAGYRSVSYSGFVNGESASALGGNVAISRSNSGVEAAGNYTGVLQASGLTASNYTISYVAGNYTIVPVNQLLVTVNAASTTYGTAAAYTLVSAQYMVNDNGTYSIRNLSVPSAAATSFTLQDGVAANASFALSPLNASLSGASQLRAGSYQLGAANITESSANFSNNITVVGNLTVNQKGVAVVPDGVAKTYDGTNAMTGLTLSLNGTLTNDVVRTNGSGVFSQANVSRDANGTVLSDVGYSLSGLTLSGADASNYLLIGGATLAGNNGTINPKQISAIGNISAADKIYDATRNATLDLSAATFAGQVGGDVLTVGSAAGLFDTKHVGSGKTVTISGLSLSGAAASNYQLANATAVTTANITQADLVVSGAMANDRIYDGSRAITISNASISALSGDNVVLSAANATVADKNVGMFKAVTTAYTLSGSDAGDYRLIQPTNLSASISQRTVALNGSSGVDKTYDGRDLITGGALGYGNLSNVVAGDSLGLSGAAAYDSANAGARSVLQGTLALNGADAPNYQLAWTNGGGNISKAALTVRANDDARFVTQSDLTGYAGVSYSGFVNGESSGVLSGSANVTRTNLATNGAGVYGGVLQASGLSSGNYNISYVNGNYTITPAQQLMITVAPTVSTYGNNVAYTLLSARYLDGANVIHDLTLPVAAATSFTLTDGVGGNASFSLAAANATFSSAGLLRAGSYQLRATNVTETSNNFSNNLTVVGNLAINAKAVNVLPSGVEKTYDATTSMSGLSLGLSGLESGDVVNATGAGAFSQASVSRSGSGSVLSDVVYTLSGLSLVGNDAANYYVSGGATLTGSNGTIRPANITLAGLATAANKKFDGKTNATVNLSGVSLSGVLNADDVRFTGGTGVFANAVAGKGKSVRISGFGLDGADAGNYDLQTQELLAQADINADVDLSVAAVRTVNLPTIPVDMRRNLMMETGLKFEAVDRQLRPMGEGAGKLSASSSGLQFERVAEAPTTTGAATAGSTSTTTEKSTDSDAAARAAALAGLGGPLKVLVVEGGLRDAAYVNLSRPRPVRRVSLSKDGS